ncbi:MAG: ABC transporter transmembrane domain-containing protein [Candidatus Sumerlaeia bacterium]
MSERLRILFRYACRYKWGYLIGLSALLGTDIFMLLRPKVVGSIVDTLGEHGTRTQIAALIGLFLAYVVSENLFRLLWRFTLIGASRRVERDMMNSFFGHLLKLDPRFFDRTPTGDLLARATNDVASIRMLMGPGIMAMFDAVIVFSITLTMMMHVSPRLTLLSLAPIPILGLIIGYLLRKIHFLYDIVQQQFSTISARAQESLSGIRVIKAHNREQYEIAQFDKVTTDYVKKYMQLTRFESALEPVIRLVAGLGVVITLFVGGQAVMAGSLTIGQLVQFFLYFLMLTWPVIAIGWSANLYERGMASLKRLQEIFEQRPTIVSPDFDLETVPIGPDDNGPMNAEMRPGGDGRKPESPRAADQPAAVAAPPPFMPGDIEFRNVSFRYHPDGPDVLKNINLTIRRGATVGVVGPTGSGKTTLLNLIARLYDPVEGEVRIGGVDIRRYRVEDLRRHIGVVPQEPFLFSLNIRENLNLGRRQNPLEEESIIEALDMADILKDVQDFPQRFDTVLGERGVRLSGGQKQRMTIARALARKNDIILLDDTLSSVDPQTEERILQNLRSFGKGRTNIIVSHRISAVKDADMIVALNEHGEIAEQGTHEQLLAGGGFYARLYQQQMLEEQIAQMNS